MGNPDTDAVPEGHYPSLQLLYLIVRPEEKAVIEAALQNVIPPLYTTMLATGRGRESGLAYSAGKKRWWQLGKESPAALFLPKVVFYMAVPQDLVDEILDAVAHALRIEGGPSDAGLGIGFVLPIEDDRPLGYVAA